MKTIITEPEILIPIQPGLEDLDLVRRYINLPPGTFNPVIPVVQDPEDGSIYVGDGHHRTTAALVRGELITINIFETDEEVKACKTGMFKHNMKYLDDFLFECKRGLIPLCHAYKIYSFHDLAYKYRLLR